MTTMPPQLNLIAGLQAAAANGRVLEVLDPSTGEVGTPKLLFSVPDGGRLAGGRTVGYDVTPDGSRFLLVTPIERPRATPIVVVINWFDELRKKSPR